MAQLASSKKSWKNSKQVDNNIDSYSQAQFCPPADQLHISVKGQTPKRDTPYRRPRISQAYPTHVPREITWSAVRQHGCCSKGCDTAANFTSDHLPQTGVILFDRALEASKLKHQASRRLASSASAERSTNVTTPHYISEMLQRIRRELGVREPCRADRKQIGDTASAETPQLAGGVLRTDGEQGVPPSASATSLAVQSAPVSSHVLYPDSGAGPSRVAPTEKSTAFKMDQEGPETCGASSEFTGATSGPPNSKCAPSEPDANFCNRVRIAHKAKQGLEAKKASSQLGWDDGVKRKRPKEASGSPR